MADFNSTIITQLGQALLAKSVAGQVNIKYTVMRTSDYQYPAGTDYAALTTLSGVRQTEDVTKVSMPSSTEARVLTEFLNDKLTTGYYIWNLGVYATDPDIGEILFSVTPATIADFFPPNTTSAVFMGAVVFPVSVDAHITIYVNPAGLQNIITAEGILFGNGAGVITTAVAGTDYGYPLLKGKVDPTNATAAEVGQHYFNTATGKEFVCTAATGGVYSWAEAGGGEAALAAHKADTGAHENIFAQSVQGYGTCATAASTAAKVGVLSGFKLATGSVVGITFTYANTNTAPTLDVNGTGAKPIYCKGAYITAGMITASMTALLQYNGTQWVLLNPADYAPTSHASATTDYGIGTTSLYGHVKAINVLTQASHVDGTALSAYQGYLLNENKAPKSHASATADYGLGTDTLYGHLKVKTGNGLALSNGELSLSVGTTSTPGALQATASNGLILSGGLLGLTLASSTLSGTINSTDYNYLYRTYFAGNSASSAVGYGALNNNTSSGVNNTATGYLSLYLNTTGTNNTAMGWNALYNNTGSSNTAIGTQALYSNTTGATNTAVGCAASQANVNGSDNTAIGFNSLNASTGSDNTAVGYASLQANTTGYSNTAVGVFAGQAVISGNSNTFLGYGAQTTLASVTNSMALGNSASVSANNTIVLGNSTIQYLRCQVQTISSLSDRRIKEDIKEADTALCLESVLNLPVTRYKYKDFTGTHSDKHVTGWLADDVETVFPKAVAAFDEYFPVLDEEGNAVKETTVETIQIGVDDDGNPIFEERSREVDKMFLMEQVKNITMSEATPTLWGAVQELYKLIESQKQEIKELKEKIA